MTAETYKHHGTGKFDRTTGPPLRLTYNNPEYVGIADYGEGLEGRTEGGQLIQFPCQLTNEGWVVHIYKHPDIQSENAHTGILVPDPDAPVQVDEVEETTSKPVLQVFNPNTAGAQSITIPSTGEREYSIITSGPYGLAETIFTVTSKSIQAHTRSVNLQEEIDWIMYTPEWNALRLLPDSATEMTHAITNDQYSNLQQFFVGNDVFFAHTHLGENSWEVQTFPDDTAKPLWVARIEQDPQSGSQRITSWRNSADHDMPIPLRRLYVAAGDRLADPFFSQFQTPTLARLNTEIENAALNRQIADMVDGPTTGPVEDAQFLSYLLTTDPTGDDGALVLFAGYTSVYKSPSNIVYRHPELVTTSVPLRKM
jgi:hypothetical protein